jgi:signal transduction histidine kinase
MHFRFRSFRPNMKNTGILLVGYSSAIDSKIATEVARMAFPRATVKTLGALDDAINSTPIADTDLLVLSRSSVADVERAMNAEDENGLPRWAVVVVGSHPVPLGAQLISPEEWAGPVTSHAFRSAIAQHSLRRDLARAQGDLTAIGVRISHDLRTQVAAILATAELSKELLQEVEPSQTELYQPIFDSVDSLGKLIERVSFLTKASAAGMVKGACKMKDVVSGAVSRLSAEIGEKRASIIQPAEWPEINASKQFLEKIWFNLIANALTHAGVSPRIELGWKKDKNEYRFWVRDRGDGVSTAARSQLFEPFHLLHRSGSPRGLGLPIVQRLSELHGGRCGYEPPQDGGSEFFFTVPA